MLVTKKKMLESLKLSFFFTAIINEPVKFVVLPCHVTVFVVMGAMIVLFLWDSRRMIESWVRLSKTIICQTICFAFQIDVIIMASV